jgi:hypothetical protein
VALITLAQAKTHLRIALDDLQHDDDLTLKMEAATVIILDYLKRPIGEWEAGSPGSPGGGSPGDDQQLTLVQIAILLVLGHLWAHRGDDLDEDQTGPITPAVESLLRRSRDPALA